MVMKLFLTINLNNIKIKITLECIPEITDRNVYIYFTHRSEIQLSTLARNSYEIKILTGNWYTIAKLLNSIIIVKFI
jgi:hypothetical protein